jgi:hypothetical protein
MSWGVTTWWWPAGCAVWALAVPARMKTLVAALAAMVVGFMSMTSLPTLA